MSDTDSETVDERERRELTALLWFFWVGIWVAVAGETTLVFLMRRTADAGGGSTGMHTLVVGALAVTMWGASALVYRKQLGGGGFPTAIFCWMLAKATAILSFVMYFLSPGWDFTWLLLGGFAAVMIALHPGRFVE